MDHIWLDSKGNPLPNPWSDAIPVDVQERIGAAIKAQMLSLPVDLIIEWHEPKYISKEFFQRASQYIDIPEKEYWQPLVFD